MKNTHARQSDNIVAINDNHNEPVTMPDSEVANQPPIELLIERAENFLRAWILQFETGKALCHGDLNPENLFKLWQGIREGLAEFAIFNDDLIRGVEEHITQSTWPTLLVAHWMRRFNPRDKKGKEKKRESILRPAIVSMFRHHAERSNWSFFEEDVADCQQKVWGQVWRALKTQGPARTYKRSIAIAEGVLVADLQACECKRGCKCPKDQMSLQRWLQKIASSTADAHYREHCERDQTEEKRLRLLRQEPNGTETFAQSVPTQASTRALRAAADLDNLMSGRDQELFSGDGDAWEGEPFPDPRMAMSLKPGALLCYGVATGWSDSEVVDHDRGDLRDAKRKTYGEPNPITHGELITGVLNAWGFNSTSHLGDKAIVVDDPARVALANYYADLSANYDAYCPQRYEECYKDYLARLRPLPGKPQGRIEFAIRRGKRPPMPVRQVTQAEWDSMMHQAPVVTFVSDKSYRADHPMKAKRKKLDEIETNLASLGMDEPVESGFSTLDNLLDPQKEEINLKREERYEPDGNVHLYHRERKRVKLVRHLDGNRTWVEVKGGERVMVDRCDLQDAPWSKPKAPKRSKTVQNVLAA